MRCAYGYDVAVYVSLCVRLPQTLFIRDRNCSFFGFGILERSDFKKLSWDTLILLAGGLALGTAIQSSQLLALIARKVRKFYSSLSFFH